MPSGKTVRPQKWSKVIDLYDDGKYSAIWGIYEYSKRRRLGLRWNGDKYSQGFPSMGNNPIWFVEPDDLAKMVLLEFCSRVIKKPKHGNLKNILTALKEC